MTPSDMLYFKTEFMLEKQDAVKVRYWYNASLFSDDENNSLTYLAHPFEFCKFPKKVVTCVGDLYECSDLIDAPNQSAILIYLHYYQGTVKVECKKDLYPYF